MTTPKLPTPPRIPQNSSARHSGESYLALRGMIYKSYVQRAQGRLHRAASICRQAIEWSREHEYLRPVRGVLHSALADVLREWNDLDAALRHAEEGVELARPLEYPDLRVFPPLVLARVLAARGEFAHALELVHVTRAGLQAFEARRYRALLDTCEAQIAVRRGDPSAALELLGRSGEEHDVDRGELHAFFFVYRDEHMRVAPIQALLAEARMSGHVEPIHTALAMLGGQIPNATADGHVWLTIKLPVLQALARHQLSDAPGALTALEGAVRLAQPEGYMRVFLEEGKPALHLLAVLVERGLDRHTEHGERILHHAECLIHAEPRSFQPPLERTSSASQVSAR